MQIQLSQACETLIVQPESDLDVAQTVLAKVHKVIAYDLTDKSLDEVPVLLMMNTQKL